MFLLRNVTEGDAPLLRHMAKNCAPLDVHTPYTYWVIAKYHADSSFLLECDGAPAGFLTALDTPGGVFVWQIGLLAPYRGRGLSQMLLDGVFAYGKSASKTLEVTIAEENAASRGAFAAACRRHGAQLEKQGVAEVRDMDDPGFTETEIRYKISL